MIYIGSTYKTLQQRLKAHEIKFKSFKAGKYNFVTVFKILENNNYNIELIELYPCESKKDLEFREGQIIKQFRNDKLNIVNRCVVGQTKAEYRQKNKAELNEKKKQLHNCSCGISYTHSHKARHEKSKKHQNYINNSKTVNIENLNLNITINNPEDLEKIIKTINKL